MRCLPTLQIEKLSSRQPQLPACHSLVYGWPRRGPSWLLDQNGASARRRMLTPM